MGMRDRKYQLCSAQVLGNAGDEYTDDEINWGVTNPNVNLGGSQSMGLHMVVTTTYTGLASGANLWLVHGAATDPTTKREGMFIPVASLVAGAHFFLPLSSKKMLQYCRGLFDIVSEVATAGASTCWIGPGIDGADDD